MIPARQLQLSNALKLMTGWMKVVRSLLFVDCFEISESTCLFALLGCKRTADLLYLKRSARQTC